MDEAEIPDVIHGHLLSPLALAMTATRDLPQPYRYAKHLHLLSQELVRLRSRAPGWPRRLMVTMPPRHGKSEHCSHWFPTWDIALDPTDRIILCSYEAEFAAKWGRACRRSMEEHYPILGARIVEDSRAAHRWETTHGGGMSTAGVGGPITGRGGNVLVLDDPIKNAEEANSRTIRDHLWDWWQSTFLTRLEPDGVIVLIMTRWHEDDLIGRLLNSPESKFWRKLDLPAVAEENDPLGRDIGAALWPERYDELALENIKAESGTRVFSALYQQHPSPAEGAGINRAWWKWYDEAPPLESFDQIIQSWDPTFKAVDTSDYVACGVWGRKGGDIYGLDGIRKRMNGPDTLKAIEAVDKQWPLAKWLLMEDTASGSMICDILERERGHVMRIKPRGQKETRLHWGVNAAAAVTERGQVWLPRNRKWALDLVDEAAQFPHGAHDDMVDQFSQAINHLLPRTWSWENMQKRAALGPNLTTQIELHNHQVHEAIRKKLKALERGPGRRRGDFQMGGL
jgi:predicted phage terminase large subunit-like protein